jgi:hypothetical protein
MKGEAKENSQERCCAPRRQAYGTGYDQSGDHGANHRGRDGMPVYLGEGPSNETLHRGLRIV